MNKSILAIVIPVLYFAGPIQALANMGDGGQPANEIVKEILAEQNVESVGGLNCANISDEKYEKLGDSVMGFMHPDDRQHELMDQLMGGEGSERLKAMHISMGQKYLGCFQSGTGSFNMMMGGGMHAPYRTGGYGMGMGDSSIPSDNKFGFNSMMNYGYMSFGWVGFLFMAAFWILVIIGIVYLIKRFAGQGGANVLTKTAVEILNERYAKGEIDKNEFEEKKRAIGN